VEEGAPLCEHAAPVHGVELAQPWVALGTLAVAGEAVACHGSVDLVTLGCKLAVAMLVELADSGHFDFLVSTCLKLSTLSGAHTRLTADLGYERPCDDVKTGFLYVSNVYSMCI
jgi:hypothetical protein